MTNVIEGFMKEVTAAWPAISAALRTHGHNPTLALEAAKARRQGFHHDTDLAAAFDATFNEIKVAADMAKIEKRKQRHTRPK